MLKLNLSGPGYYLDIISDSSEREMRITIQHGQRGIASADLSANQLLLLKEHLDDVLDPARRRIPCKKNNRCGRYDCMECRR